MHMFNWEFDGGPHADAWTWSCVDSATGRVLRRSGRSFSTLGECALDAVKHRVADLRKDGDLDTVLEQALISREFLGSLVKRAERADDEQLPAIEQRLAEVEGVIAMLHDTTRRH